MEHGRIPGLLSVGGHVDQESHAPNHHRLWSCSQNSPVLGPSVLHNRSAVENATHRPISPRRRRVIESSPRVDGRDEDACRMQSKAAGYYAVWANEERRPTTL